MNRFNPHGMATILYFSLSFIIEIIDGLYYDELEEQTSLEEQDEETYHIVEISERAIKDAIQLTFNNHFRYRNWTTEPFKPADIIKSYAEKGVIVSTEIEEGEVIYSFSEMD